MSLQWKLAKGKRFACSDKTPFALSHERRSLSNIETMSMVPSGILNKKNQNTHETKRSCQSVICNANFSLERKKEGKKRIPLPTPPIPARTRYLPTRARRLLRNGYYFFLHPAVFAILCHFPNFQVVLVANEKGAIMPARSFWKGKAFH